MFGARRNSPATSAYAVLSNKEMRYDMTVAHTFYAAGSTTDRSTRERFFFGHRRKIFKVEIEYCLLTNNQRRVILRT